MSIDAYKIAVKIALVENVTAGLASMSKHFATANLGAKELNAQLKRIGQTAMIGGGLVAMGGIGIHMFKGPLDEAKKYQQEMGKLSAQGVGDSALVQADKFARAQKIMGASATDTMKMLSETTSILRDQHEAEAVTPMLLKMKFGIESVMGNGHGANMEQQFMAALKVGELRGAVTDRVTGKFSEEKLKETMDFMTRAYTASGGLVKPSDYLAMIKTGGVAAKGLDDQAFYFGLMHMMQEQRGSRVGTSLMSGFQNMYMGRTTQQVAELMAKDGLLDKSKIHYGKTGHVTKLDSESIVQADLFKTDQFRYMNEVIIPRLKKQGIKDGDEMQMAIAKLFSNRTAGNLWTSMYMERFNIQKHIDAAQGAMGIDDLAKAGSKTLMGQEIQYEAKLASLKLELGQKILPIAIKSLEILISVIDKITDFTKKYPTITEFILKTFALIAGIALARGAMMLFTASLMGLDLLKPAAIAMQILGASLPTVSAGAAVSSTGIGRLGASIGSLAAGGTIIMTAVAGIGLLVGAVSAMSWVLSRDIFNSKTDSSHPGQHWRPDGRGVKTGTWIDDATGMPASQAQKIAAAKKDHEGEHFVRAGRSGTWVKNAEKPIQVNTSIQINSREVARAVTTHQAIEANRPSLSGSQYDPSMSPRSVGVN